MGVEDVRTRSCLAQNRRISEKPGGMFYQKLYNIALYAPKISTLLSFKKPHCVFFPKNAFTDGRGRSTLLSAAEQVLAKVEKKVFAAMLEELTEYCDDGEGGGLLGVWFVGWVWGRGRGRGKKTKKWVVGCFVFSGWLVVCFFLRSEKKHSPTFCIVLHTVDV